MADKTPRRLKRAELLEMLIEQGKENERLRAQVEELEKQLADREIRLKPAGTIAEAALRLNGVFEAAEAAAQQYIDSIRALNERQEQLCARMEKEAAERESCTEEEIAKRISRE